MLASRVSAVSRPALRGARALRPTPRLVLVRAASSSASVADGPSTSRPSWDIRMLYDGDCPLCMKEVNFLKGRNETGKIDFVDISAPGYDPAQNAGISWEQAMASIHAITAEGRIVSGVEVFRLLYEAVGLGWVYAATKNPSVMAFATNVYDFWAKYRTQVTGREALSVLAERRRLEAAGKQGSCRTVEEAVAAGGGQKREA